MTAFFKKISATHLILACLLILGGILRLIDLNDPPLDFHSTRQLRNILVARDIYYQLSPDADTQLKELAATFSNRVGDFEPPIIESLVALGYKLTGGESFATPRILNTIFWLLAGLALFDLARRMTSDEGALIALAFYLILPFSVQASRSFQPDPLMTSLFVSGLYALYRWVEEKTWKWAILAALLLGLATLIKIVIAFFVAGAVITAVLLAYGWKKVWKSPQVWAMALIMILPAFSYYILGSGERSGEYFISWTLDLLHLLSSTKFYLQWMTFIGSLFGLPIIYLSIIGVFLLPSRGRALLVSVWIGYLLYGLTLPFQMYTHSYYHIQLIPIIALGIAPIAQLIAEQAKGQGRFWRSLLIGIILLGVAYPAWVARSVLVSENYQHEIPFWESIGEAIPPESKTIALTQDYGYRLMALGWRKVALWPIDTELMKVRGGGIDAQKEFAGLTEGKDFFLITAFGQYEKQAGLREILETYPIAAEGDGYLLIDLRK
ncbi:MAG: phospholipid carrier-dependent glycosyltransferase [Anaerolineae bacterium]|jgi:4-amino-4-deoxy-L-arabinose transferase-like glycosyltransferase|nr:phospholipid carrier-dependent glycosyltransferase [Anaerolineae bacterium]MBT4458769.1 phospholipid carrier-dependent glycosyltransferase [Anaerolineae bacterium]MBT4842221.1 phospholipid carrier-dependent glycosyltransferase [Anaerolineae bacterium]MBT6062901.1 phospholipid carrier-dependent glycosyltransferase [Anaerolineae bacterium]MBT6323216.1 phospholipid carrier-dependent glycosyltransferase [Anaerolineae bacterium]